MALTISSSRASRLLGIGRPRREAKSGCQGFSCFVLPDLQGFSSFVVRLLSVLVPRDLPGNFVRLSGCYGLPSPFSENGDSSFLTQ